MVWESRPGIKDKSNILVNSKRVERPEKDDLSLMEVIMMETLWMASSMEKVNTILLILVRYMKAFSKITTCMGAE